jgi:hypothetical protein
VDSKHPPGRIANLSSISGGVAFYMITLYAMTKHAMEATKPKTRYLLVGLWQYRKIVPNRLLDRMVIKACGHNY